MLDENWISGLRILFAGDIDYANCAHRASYAINKYAGFRCARVLVNHRHRLGYKEDLCCKDRDGMSSAISHLKSGPNPWIFTTGDGSYTLFNLLRGTIGNAETGALHIGSDYRSSSGKFNSIDEGVARVRFISPDSMHLTNGSGFPYIHSVSPIETSTIKVVEQPLIIHSPSSFNTKGTALILDVISRLKGSLKYHSFSYRTISGMKHRECSAERRNGHIFIGQLNPDVGCFGYSCVESASEGLLPLASRNNAPDEIWTDVGLDPPPIINTPTTSSLFDELKKLIQDPFLLYSLRNKSIKWVDTGGASLNVVGKYYLERIYASI